MDVTNFSIFTYSTNHSTHVVTTNYAAYYSFATNVIFYDYRESQQMNAIQIDVGKFGAWLTNNSVGVNDQSQNLSAGSSGKGHGIDGVYVYNNIPNTSSQTPAVRAVNGQQLPAYGLTVATPFPLYVKGDFNITTNGVNFSTAMGDVANTAPAALMGDAITILSSSYVDTTSSSAATRNASQANSWGTTINAACLEGIVPSNGTYYSGGVENFLRLLEDWTGVSLNYNGSIVVLFPSQYAVNPWTSTGYYQPPARNWAFDNNFLNPQFHIPMEPMLRAWYRGQWATW
jgi:hypothetical protein